MNFEKFKEHIDLMISFYEEDGHVEHLLEAANRCFALQDIFDEQYEVVFSKEEREYMNAIIKRSIKAMLKDLADWAKIKKEGGEV